MTATFTRPCLRPSCKAVEDALTLADGTTLAVRRATPADAAALQRLYDGLSTRSRYHRFFAPVTVSTAERARAFTQLDSADGFALVALDPVQPAALVAVVGYGRDAGAEHAEYAATVADEWQGRGVGLALTLRLIAAARARGVRRFSAAMLPENARMRRLFAALELAMGGQWEGGFVWIDLDLTSAGDDEAMQRALPASHVAVALDPFLLAILGFTHVSGEDSLRNAVR